MRKSASQIIRNLEMRIARLEKQVGREQMGKSASRYRRETDYVMDQVIQSYARRPYSIKTTFKAGNKYQRYIGEKNVWKTRPVSSWGDSKWEWEGILNRRDELVWVLNSASRNVGDVGIGVEFDKNSFIFFAEEEFTENSDFGRWSAKIPLNSRGDIQKNFEVASKKALSLFTDMCRDEATTELDPDWDGGADGE